MRHYLSNQRGNIALMLLVSTSMLLMGNMEVLTLMGQQRMQSFVDGRGIALQMAQLGAQVAVWEFNHGGAYFTGDGWADAGTGCGEGAVSCVGKTILLPENPGVASSPSNTASVLVKDHRALNPEVISTGIHGATNTRTRIRVTLSQTPVSSPFKQAGYGTNNVANSPGVMLMWNNGPSLMDSYDSSLGEYDAILNHGDAAEVHVSNDPNPDPTVLDRNIIIAGGSTLRGNAFVKAPPKPPIVNNGIDSTTGTYVGTLTNSVAPTSFSSAPTPSAPFSSCTSTTDVINVGTDSRSTTDPVTGQKVLHLEDTHLCVRNLFVNANQRLELPNLRELYVREHIYVTGVNSNLRAGQGVIRAEYVHVCSGSCNVVLSTPPAGNRATLESTNGPLDVYSRNVEMRQFGEIRGYQKKPENMHFYYDSSIGTLSTRNLGANGKFYGVMYSPNGVTHIASDGYNAEVFGAVIVPQVYVAGSKVHYDVKLKDATVWPIWLAGPGVKRVTITRWKQEK